MCMCRAEWQALQSGPSTALPASHPPYLRQNTSPGILTSDLVQVSMLSIYKYMYIFTYTHIVHVFNER